MESEIIVELLGEGGSRVLYGARDGDGWLFSRRGPIDAPSISSARKWKGIVAGLPAALAELDQYRHWYELSPNNIHPEFADAFLEAVRARAPSERALAKWESACNRARTSTPVKTTVAAHASDDWLYFEDPDTPDEERNAWLTSKTNKGD